MTSTALGDEQLRDALDQIPALAHPDRVIEELSGGLTNRNLKVTTPTGSYVARCSSASGDALGIDRTAEHHNTVAAAEAGVGAAVVDYRPDLGILVIEYIDGVTLSRESFTEPGVVERAAQSCRRLHEGPRFQGRFDMFERQQGYLRTVTDHGYRLPDGYLDHADELDRIRVALAVQDPGTVPCNNDLLAENFVDDGEKIWLIDYEYAGNNDACFELGNIWCECRLSLEQLEELTTSYFGGHTRSRLARSRLQGIVGQYGWTLWGAIQHAVSPLDYDFWEWATERYEIALAELGGPDLERLLGDVVRAD